MSEKSKKKGNSWIADLFFRVYNDSKRRRYAKENRKIQGHPVVFFGDSITDNCDLEKYYPGIYALNRGISGNTTEDLLKRMKVSVYDAHPSQVVLLIGINDMMNEGYRPRAVAFRYREILWRLKKYCPDAQIICQSVYPGWDGDPSKADRGQVFPIAYLAEDIVELNGYIKKLCEKHGCAYVDVHSCLKLEDDTMDHSCSFDGCHPNDEGYRRVSAVLRPYLE